jgi:hypothetical protein
MVGYRSNRRSVYDRLLSLASLDLSLIDTLISLRR